MKKGKNILLLTIFIILSLLVSFMQKGLKLDYFILNILHKNDSKVILNLSKVISFMGSGKFIILIFIILSLYFYNKNQYKYIKFLSLNIFLSSIINIFLKNIIVRKRPVDYFRIIYSGYSFPSGHSMVNMSFILSLMHIFEKEKLFKKEYRFLGYLYIFLMGFSRLYLGVHWPSDVLGGFLLGYLVYSYSIKHMNET